MEETEKLSQKEYWDEVLQAAQLPRVIDDSKYNYRVTTKFIKPHLSKEGYENLFEVGCGSSAWLPYFAKKYHYRVGGVDYSEAGCRLAEMNLDMQSIDHGPIICADFFSLGPGQINAYDVVFSYGFIEHFEHPEKIIEKMKGFLKPGGTIITLIPNLNGLRGWVPKVFVRKVYDQHKVIKPKEMKAIHEQSGLEHVTTKYVGTFTLSTIPWAKSDTWLTRPNTLRRRVFMKFVITVDRISAILLNLTKIEIPTRHFSPYIITIAKRKKR